MNPCLAEGMTIASQEGVQFIGVVATFAYTAIATYIILKVVGMMR
jgi:Amt family ammonium transporter